LKVCEKVWPTGSRLEFSSVPESEIIVCWKESLLTHATVPPTLVVIVLGEKEKFEIVTKVPLPVVPGLGEY